MQVVIGSAFRDATGYIERYCEQAAALRDMLARYGHRVRLALVEGDSTDGTRPALEREIARYRLDADIVERSHGGSSAGTGLVAHSASPLRFKELAFVGNGILAQLTSADDALLYVESDLIWDTPTALALLGHVAEHGADVAVPLVMMKTSFYDTWAYRAGGRPFAAHWPYHAALRGWQPGRLVPLDAAGSCLALNRAALRAAQRFGFSTWDVWPGLCRALRGAEFRIMLDPGLRVEHPLVG